MIDLKTNKTYCPYIFRGGIIKVPDGNFEPCCRFDQQQYSKEYLQDGYNSVWKDIRKQSLNGEKIQGCWRCYQDEQAGLKSMRTAAFTEHSDVPYQDYKNQNDLSNTKLEFLEIQTGRYCNLKCRSCGPWLSTTWDEDLEADSTVEEHFFGKNSTRFTDIKLLPKVNESLVKFSYDTLKDLKRIKATGGEPFLSDQFQNFLSNLVDWNIAKNIDIEVFTNCSFFPKQQYRELLPKFKSIKITLSLDAVDQRAEFLRKNSSWNKVTESATKWIDFALENSQTRISISHTVTVYNALYLGEFIDWMMPHFSKIILENKFDFDLHLAQTPQYMSLLNVNSQIQKQMLKIIQEQQQKILSKHPNYSSMINKSYDRITKGLSKHVSDLSQVFLEKTKLIDHVRNEKWQNTFPELAEVLDE